jgi:hypothetical protein
MKKWLVMMVVAACAAGCGEEKKDDKKEDAKAASGGGSLPQACNDYFTKLDACLGKLPDAAKGAMEASKKTNKDAWEAMSKDAAQKAALENVCKQSVDALAANPACK